MTLTPGTNCGIVETAPTADPVGDGGRTIDSYKRGIKVILTQSVTIIEMGWWCDLPTEESNFEMGIYEDNAGVPGDRLYVDATNAKGTTAGWKVVSGLNWTLSAGTYWLALQLDDTATTTTVDYGAVTGETYCYTSGATELPDPFGSTSTSANQILAIYGLISTTTYHLTGVTKDKNGSVPGSCECFLFKDNGDDTLTFVDYQVSNASTGVYDFTGLSDDDAAYLVYSVKDGSPNVFDVTDHVLQPVEE